MVLRTIGPLRFGGKLPYSMLRRWRAVTASPLAWSSTIFAQDSKVSPLAGRWLFGATADLSAPPFDNDRGRVLALAESASRRSFEVNSRKIELYLPPHYGRWDVDPVSGKRWPQRSAFAPLRDMPGDVRYVWEIDRLHHLVTFGQAWRYTRDPQWVSIAIGHLCEVLSEAPFEHGIHWRDGLQLTVRLHSLVALADLCHDASPDLHACINNAVAAHAFALSRQLSPHSEITNNHSIGESCGLVLSGIYLDDQRLLHKGLRRLRIELDRQLYSDGIPYEGSIPYVRFDLDFLCLSLLAMRRTGVHVPEWLVRSVEAMASALGTIADCEGRIPPIGDGDDGRVLRLDDEPYLAVNESLHVASHLTSKPLAPAPARRMFAAWAVGTTESTRSPATSVIHLPASGLVHLRRGPLDVWLDCGPTGLGRVGPGGHGHNDTTAVVVHLSGNALLHDPGWFTYYGDRAMRNRLRGTWAHNTIRVNGQEQADLGDLFEIANQCTPTEVKTRTFGGERVAAVICGHTGYHRLRRGIEYRRFVIVEGFGPWRVRVTDRIRAAQNVTVEARLGSDYEWQAAPDSRWVLRTQHVWRPRGGQQNVRCTRAPYSTRTGELLEGSAIEWRVRARPQQAGGFSYVSRWELIVGNDA